MQEKVFSFFKIISSIPRETYHIKEISNYLVEFAKERKLEVYQDNSFNVIIKKEASKGYEEKEGIILQTHMDMVCQKTNDSKHNFRKEGIKIIQDDGYLRANKTTLGADDGIGMAIVLAILDGNYQHPKIEALFTVNEEVGMDGAYQIDMNKLTSNRLINIDSEEEGIITIGCAGGVQLESMIKGSKEKRKGTAITINITNLRGGHSGTDIDKKRVNAIKFIIDEIDFRDKYLIEINGGKVDNAIADSVSLSFLTSEKIDSSKLENQLREKLKKLKEEKADVEIITSKEELLVFDNQSTTRIIQYLKEVPNGIVSYEKVLKNKVSTSLNLGIIKTNKDEIIINHLIRSSNEEEKRSLLKNIYQIGKKSFANIHEKNSYPSWEYQENSYLRNFLKEQYKKMFNKELEIDITHAGLECGILVSKKKDLDCVSIGPNVLDAHTPKEKVEIESVNRVYNFLIEVLKEMI